eukprot:350534_1
MSKSYVKSMQLMQEAQSLIKQNAFDKNGGISSTHNKSQIELSNNKKGFNKLIKASKLNIHWQPHFNLAEFYYSGLDGATAKNIQKCVDHYIQAWKLTNNTMIKQTSTSNINELESLLLNLCGVLENIDLNNKKYVNTNEIIRLAKRLHKHSKLTSFKIFGHWIHGIILLRLSQRAKAYIQFQKCIKQKNKHTNIGYYANHFLIKAEEMLHTMDITRKALNEQQMNNEKFQFMAGDGRYKQNFEYYQKQKEKLNADNTDKLKLMSGVNNEKINTVLVTRVLHENNQNSLVTLGINETVSIASGNSAERKCAYCGILGLNMKLCSRCKSVHYCDAKCQKPHWKEHKKQCKK